MRRASSFLSGLEASGRTFLSLSLSRFHARLWFPHVPLALGLMLFGFRNLHPLLTEIANLRTGAVHYSPVQEFRALPEFFHDLGKGPHSLIGILEILMAVGLLFRSRFAWSVALVLVSASLGILLYPAWTMSLRAAGDLLLLAGLLFFVGIFHGPIWPREHFFLSSALSFSSDMRFSGPISSGKGFLLRSILF